MTNVLEEVPGKQWDHEYRLEMIQQALGTEDYDQALRFAEEGIKEAEHDPTYLEKFQDALKQIKIESNPRDIVRGSQLHKREQSKNHSQFILTEIHGIGKATAEKLRQIDITTPEQLTKTPPEKLAEIDGISQNSALKFIASAQHLLDHTEDNIQIKVKKSRSRKEKKKTRRRSQKEFSPSIQKRGLGLDTYIGINSTTKKRTSNTVSSQESSDFHSKKPKNSESSDRTLNNNNKVKDDISEPNIETLKENLMVEPIEQEPPEINIEKLEGEKNTGEIDVQENAEISPTKLLSVKKRAEFVIPKKVNELNGSQNKYNKTVQIQSDPKEEILPDTPAQPTQDTTEEIPTEITDKRDLLQKKENTLTKEIKHILSKDFYILKDNPILDCDCLVLKSTRVSEYEFSLLIVPIRATVSDKYILLSEDQISIPTENKVDLDYGMVFNDIGLLSEAKAEIFHNIITKDILYSFLRNYLREDFKLEYVTEEKQLYFHCGKVSYSIYISPIYVCNPAVRFREKRIPFPYQRHSDLHIVNIEKLSRLMNFLTRKFAAITTHHHPEHDMTTEARAYNNYLIKVRNYSFPTMFFGIILGVFMILFYEFITILFGLSITASVFHIFIMIWVYFNYKEERDTIRQYKGKGLNETDLEIISESFTPEEMEQFLYEYFGKKCRFTVNKEKCLHKYDNPSEHEDLCDVKMKTEKMHNLASDDGVDSKDKDHAHMEGADGEGEEKDEMVKKYLTMIDND